MYVTATMLKEGVKYLHKNKIFYRTITDIVDKSVYYVSDDGIGGYCSKAHFVRTCPKVASLKEIKEVDDLRHDFYGDK